jgi:thioesterase domain-containing protein
MAQLETELATVKAAMQWVLANVNQATKPTNGYHAPASQVPAVTEWQPPLAEELASQTLSEDELVQIQYMNDDDVRQALLEFEQKYGLSSEEFYRRWQRNEAEEIDDKSTWVILYKDWLHIMAEKQNAVEVAA